MRKWQSIPTGTRVRWEVHGWFKFLSLRDGQEGHPQYEIVQGALQVADHLRGLYPVTFAAWEADRV